MEESIPNIQKIISSNGNDKEAWENLICDINSDETNINNDIYLTLEQNLKDKSNIDITLDIIDLIVIYGPIKIVELFAKKEFLKNILELLKNSSNSSVNIQKKIIFLIQKWGKKYENEINSNLSGFLEKYNSLKKGGIIFPPLTYKLETFTKYITDEEVQCAQIKANAINKIKKDNEKSIKESLNNINNFANPFSGSGELNEKADKKIFNNESTFSGKKELNNEEDDNPYKENNDNDIDNKNINNFEDNKTGNNLNNNDNFNNNKFNNNDNNEDNIYPLGHPKNKNKNFFNEESNQQDSKYPQYPSQFGNNMKNNLQNNNNLNNINNNIDNNIDNDIYNNNNNNNLNNNNLNNNMNNTKNRRNTIDNNNNNWNANNVNNNMNEANNRGNNNNIFNNNQQNNNMRRNRSNTTGNMGNFNNNLRNNQFPNNYNNNYNNRNNQNNYNNNNFNNNYNNRNINMNNFNNYNYNNNNFNNNFNNNNNNSNYNRTNTNYNNRFNNNNFNNNNNFSRQTMDTYDIQSFKQTLGNRLLLLNSWIDDGRYSFNSGKLKEGIIEIIKEIPKCEYMMNKCQLNNDKRGYETARNMRMDMEQTCSRYEDLMNNRRIEPFYSAFSGNSRQYYFNKAYMFGNQNNIVPMNNFEDYYKGRSGSGSGSNSNFNSNYGEQNYQEKEVTIEDRLSNFGNTFKEGLFFVGGKIKNTAVSGYNFVKDKFNDNDNKDLNDE